MSKPTKEEILKVMEENIDAYYELPHYGLIADWFKRYWQLHQLIDEYFDEKDAK